MIEVSHALTIIAILILAGACASKISSRLNLPALLIFLAVGMLAGSDGIGKIPFDNAAVANTIGTVAMAFILFSGGFDTQWKSVKPVLGYGSVLSSIGVLLTALFTGLFAYWGLNLFSPDIPYSLEWCLLLGAIVSSTDAAAVFAILRSKSVSLKGRLQPLLEFESGSNDPMAAFLTIFMVGMIAEPGTSYWLILPNFLIKMTIGILFGLLWGKLAIWLYNRINLEYDGLYYVLGIGFVILTFGSSEWSYGNGFMSVYVAGMVMGNGKFIFQNGLGRFLDGMAWLMQVLLFVMLGLLCFPSRLKEVAVAGLLIALFLMFVARPLAVFLGLTGSRFDKRERLFISWVGLRGGAPIMLVTYPMLADTPRAWVLFEIVFLIVLTSVFIQGMTLMPLARKLHLDKPLRETARSPLAFENTGSSANETAEFEVPKGSLLAGKNLVELNLPEGALILLIRRGGEFIVPRGNTQIREKDHLMVIANHKAIEEIGRRFEEKRAANA